MVTSLLLEMPLLNNKIEVKGKNYYFTINTFYSQKFPSIRERSIFCEKVKLLFVNSILPNNWHTYYFESSVAISAQIYKVGSSWDGDNIDGFYRKFLLDILCRKKVLLDDNIKIVKSYCSTFHSVKSRSEEKIVIYIKAC